MTIVHKFEPEKEEKLAGWRVKKITIFIGFGLIVLVILEIWVNHTLAIYGVKFKDIEDLQRNLSLENQLLENEISRYSSLGNVASASGSLGLKLPKDIKYIR